MRDETEGGISQEIRNALLDASELSISEIYAKCTLASSTNAVASLMYTECKVGRACRIGERGSYRYKLTELGVAVAKNPKLLKSRFVRRKTGHPTPHIPPEVVDRNSVGRREPPISSDANRDIPLPRMGATTARAADADQLNFGDPRLRLAGAVLVYWPRGHAIPVSLSDLILETIDRARLLV